MTIVPFGAWPGFNLKAEMREVAAHYGVPWRALGAPGRSKSEVIALARHALFWKLTHGRGLSPARVAQLIGRVSRKAVREGAALHAKRIAEFKETSGIRAKGE